MLSLTLKDIKQCYSKVKGRAWKAFQRKDYNATLRELSISANIAYSFNWIYSDLNSEELLKQTSHALFGEPESFPKTNRIVFYDAFGWDNKGLTQQYVKALVHLEIEFLFVFENRDVKRSKALLEDLKQGGDKVDIFEIDRTKDLVGQCRMLFDKIKEYAPSQAFMHLEPASTMALCTFSAFPDIVKYNINLTDHAFWLGCKCVDYNIEFRDYGYTVSMGKRGFAENQLLQLPYYPVQNKIEFKGWPKIGGEKRIKIFSGGSFYKIYGENAFFFHLVKQLLLDNPMTVIYFAGWGNSILLKKFIAENNFEDRFFLLGDRSDIDAVFENCDIYLGTYPFAGGLMSQYAAIHAKPILAYTKRSLPSNEIEGIICHNYKESVTHYTEEEFFEYAQRLCRDEVFRKNEGKRLERCVITPEQFSSGLKDILIYKLSYKKYVHVHINYQKWMDLYLELENKFQDNFRFLIFARYRFGVIKIFPVLFFKSMPFLIQYIYKRLFKYSD